MEVFILCINANVDLVKGDKVKHQVKMTSCRPPECSVLAFNHYNSVLQIVQGIKKVMGFVTNMLYVTHVRCSCRSVLKHHNAEGEYFGSPS